MAEHCNHGVLYFENEITKGKHDNQNKNVAASKIDNVDLGESIQHSIYIDHKLEGCHALKVDESMNNSEKNSVNELALVAKTDDQNINVTKKENDLKENVQNPVNLCVNSISEGQPILDVNEDLNSRTPHSVDEMISVSNHANHADRETNIDNKSINLESSSYDSINVGAVPNSDVHTDGKFATDKDQKKSRSENDTISEDERDTISKDIPALNLTDYLNRRRTHSADEMISVNNTVSHHTDKETNSDNESVDMEISSQHSINGKDDAQMKVHSDAKLAAAKKRRRTQSENETLTINIPTIQNERNLVEEGNDTILKLEESIQNAMNSKGIRKLGIRPENLIENAFFAARQEEGLYHPWSRHGSIRSYQQTLPSILSGVPLDTTSVSRKNSLLQQSDALIYQNYLQGYRDRKFSAFSIGNTSDPGLIGRDLTEKIPELNFYRNSICEIQRPTLFQLRQSKKAVSASSAIELSAPLANELSDDVKTGTDKTEPSSPIKAGGTKFGWLIGVFMRCVLNIFGVMLFLRMTWMTGQAGIGFSTIIILISMLVVLFTTMSMSAICTNGEVGAGGTYYMISRSLGPEFGGSIGIIFSLANAVGVSMNILGFAETIRDIMWDHGATITNDRIHDVRVVSVLGCGLCLFIVLVGMEWESKAQVLFLVLMIVSLANYFIGTLIPPNEDEKWLGYVYYNGESFRKNFGPHYSSDQDFFTVFAIFFPSYTGVLAGATISGDLKNPSTAIPKGTFWSIFVTTLVYLGIVWTSGSSMVLESVGEITQAERMIHNSTMMNETLYYTATRDLVQNCSMFGKECNGGLLQQTDMVGIASIFRPLVYPGIFAATLSSAFGSMICAPKTFQALGNDKLFPGVRFFAKGYGKNCEPFRAYVLCFVIAAAMVLIGSLDIIAPIISNFFLMSFALINFACFHSSMANSPGFRPGYKYYNKWLSLLGASMCIAVMFLINWWSALITIAVATALYLYVHVKKPDVNWGSSSQAIVYNTCLKSAMKLVNVGDHVKNYRPQILLLTGNPKNRSNLVDFAATITKKQSLLICGHILLGEMETNVTKLRSMAVYKWFQKRKLKSFYSIVCAPTIRIGVQVFLQTTGIGKLRPNTLLIGYKCDWLTADPADVLDYFNIIQDAFDLQYAVGILRVKDGFEEERIQSIYSDHEVNLPVSDTDSDDDSDCAQTKENDVPQANGVLRSTVKQNKSIIQKAVHRLTWGVDNRAFEGDSGINEPVSERTRKFKEKHYGTIDVWWLYDDGGLTLLIPYILRMRKQWKHCKLRVFCLGFGDDCTEEEAKESMDLLLSKFRIEYSELHVLTDVNKKPQLSTYREFEKILMEWRVKPDEMQEDYPWKISDTDIRENKQKTYRHLRLREKMLECSKDSSLIVMTLPVPTKTACPAGLYMGFLEMLTRDMPPIFLLRGNQESVLTYYS